MGIVDEKSFLNNEEQENYQKLLRLHHHKPYDFLVEIQEDQGPMDMNDMDYVIILKIKITHVNTGVSNTYLSKLGSQTWLHELENDFNHNYYSKAKTSSPTQQEN
jgi:hypothetical protein